MSLRFALLAVLVSLLMAGTAVICCAQATGQLPPHVIACTPTPFAANVDPGLIAVTVIFDRPMATHGPSPFSSLRGMGFSPAAKDAVPTWSADGTICTLPVKLEPGLTYALTLNSADDRTLADPDGVTALAFSWVFATGPRTTGEFPTHVVSSDPPPGALNVDPRKTSISVTFDRPIAPGGHAWVILRGSATFPPLKGDEPARLSADRLTATVGVTLAPNTVYALEINDKDYIGYADTTDRPVLPYAWYFKTGGGDANGPPPE
jgi:hypothetical protein